MTPTKLWSEFKLWQIIHRDDMTGLGEQAVVGCRLCGGTHLDKECPLNEEVKGVEEVKYGELGRSFPNNGGNRSRYRVAQNEQLTKNFLVKVAKEASSSSTLIGHYKAISADNDAQSVSMKENEGSSRVLPCQLPPKELNPWSFTLPCTIGSLNVYALANLVGIADMLKKAHVGIEDRILFDMNGNVHHPTIPIEKVYMANSIQEEESFNPLEIGFEEEEQRESDMDGTYYDPPELSVDSFEVKRYSFDNGKSFVCVKKMLKDELPLGRVTGSRFKRMIRKEMEIAGSVRRTT
ncbi:hypothetical protein Tco_0290299 [Tanacetum coccineum]